MIVQTATLDALPGMKAGDVYSKPGSRVIMRVVALADGNATIERVYAARRDRRGILRAWA